MEQYRELSVGIVTCEVENTPCKMDAVTKDTLCLTPTIQTMTPSPGIVAENPDVEVLAPSQTEILARPPLIPHRELEPDENENILCQIEMSPKIMVQVKAVAVLKEMPFRERNREEGKRMIPPHIKVPPKKMFGYPERYKSPTDAMVSPISKGLLARNRRPARTLAPAVPPKALENTFLDVVVDGPEGNTE